MSDKIINIARNTSYYTLALIIQKIISFSYFVIIARALGPEDLGKYYFAISFTTIFAIFIDLGFTNVLTRETAKQHDDAGNLLNNILAIKIPLSILSLTAVIVIINLLGYPNLTKTLVYISSICMILDSFTATFFATSRGFHNLSFESISSIIFQLIVLISGLLSLKFDYGIKWLMWALAMASTFNFIYSFGVVRKKWQIKIKPRFNQQLTKKLILITLPFAVFAVSQRLYMYLDSVLLSKLAGDREVGIYQIAFKIIFALQFLPAAFSASLYPAFANYWVKNKQQLAITFERAINYLIIISLPIMVGIMSIADKVVLLFKEGYGDAVLPLRINIISLFFIFLNFAIGALLNACDRQKINTVNMIAATLLSIGLNLLLIPGLKAVGASIAVVVTNLFMFVFGMIIVPKIIKYDYWKLIKIFFKVGFSSAIMGLSAIFLKKYLNVFAVVGISGLVYFCLLFILKGFKKQDIGSILASFRKKNGETNR